MFDDYIKDKTVLEENEDKSQNDTITSEEDHEISKLTRETHTKNHNLPDSVIPWSVFSAEEKYTQQLLDAGYTSVKLLVTATLEELKSLTNIPEHYLVKLLQRSNEWLQYKFETAANLLTSRSEMTRIPTGSRALDNLMGGGIEARSITEIYGSYTTGKTQVCIQLAINGVLLDKNEKSYVIYIDTEGSFRPERIIQMCEPLGIDPKEVLSHILVGRVHNTNIQMKSVNRILELAKDKSIKLIIVDSLTSNFRAEFIGKGTLMERQQKLNQHVQQLSKIGDMLNTAVVVTNQVISVIDGFENSVIPVGGNILAHGSTHRIQFTKSDKHDQIRYAKLVASPSFPDGEAPFRITTEGITDV